MTDGDEMASNDVCGLCGAHGTALDHGTLGCAERLRAEVAALRKRLAAVEQERDAEARAASNHAAEAERMLRSACDLRDALDSVAAVLGVDTNTSAETEAQACVSAVVALREEALGRGAMLVVADKAWKVQKERLAAAERRAEEAADLLRGGVSLAHDLRQRAYGAPKMSDTPPLVARSLAWEEAASSWLASGYARRG